MAAFKTIGNWLDGRGWTSALVEADITTPGTADSFLKASHLTRTRHAHQVTASSLNILMHRSYDKYKDSLSPNDTPDVFDAWRSRRIQENPQFEYWATTLEYELIILSFVRSIREGSFQLYIEAVDQLMPWFFALDHPHYSRWLSVHLRDMRNLENVLPAIAAEFESGKFFLKKTHRSFSSIAIDHAHEQNNAYIKGDGGPIGLTANTSQLMRWMVVGPEMARVVSEFEESVESIKEKQSHGPDIKHHEQVKSVQVRFAKQVQSLCNTIEEFGNPFEEHTTDLLVLDTRDVEVVTSVRNIKTLGKELYTRFVEARLVQRSESLFKPLKRNKLVLFSCPKRVVKSNDKQEIASLKKTCALFSRMYVSCQVCEGNIDEFFCHENQGSPLSLSKFGDLRSGTNADLVECFANTYPSTTVDVQEPQVDAILLDGAAVINILKPGVAKTFKEYSELVFLPFIESQLKKASRVDIVWDEYIPDSLKAMTRSKRGKGTRRRVQPNSKIPGDWAAFLRINDNKVELFAYLSHESVTHPGLFKS